MTAMAAVDRNVVSVPVLLGTPQTCQQVAATTPTTTNLVLIPRCTLTLEKCRDGLKLQCNCPDERTTANLQQLCTLLCTGTVTCVAQQNGQTVLTCNLTQGRCQCQTTPQGVCITCTSGDQQCCRMIQECCNCLQALLECGCTCYVCLNNTPVCCGTCEQCR